MHRKKITLLIFTVCLLAACAGPNPNAPLDCSRLDVFCVGLVTDVGKLNDSLANQSAWAGLKQAEKELGAHVAYVETAASRDYAKNIAFFADDKYDVIVTVGTNLSEATFEAARQYPDVKFIGVDQAQTEKIDNLADLVTSEPQIGASTFALIRLAKNGQFPGGVYKGQN